MHGLSAHMHEVHQCIIPQIHFLLHVVHVLTPSVAHARVVERAQNYSVISSSAVKVKATLALWRSAALP